MNAEDAVAAAGEGDEEADEPDSQGSVTPPYTLGQEKFDNGFRDLSPRTIRETLRRLAAMKSAGEPRR